VSSCTEEMSAVSSSPDAYRKIRSLRSSSG
jgi:hypothetical protein